MMNRLDVPLMRYLTSASKISYRVKLGLNPAPTPLIGIIDQTIRDYYAD